jgi:phage/plasmid-associated DNA primase
MKRGPDGKWVTRSELLSAWLPTLLDWAIGNAIVTMLKGSSKWCELRAAKEYKRAASALETWVDSNSQGYAEVRASEAARWFARKAILLRAKAEIEAIR